MVIINVFSSRSVNVPLPLNGLKGQARIYEFPLGRKTCFIPTPS